MLHARVPAPTQPGILPRRDLAVAWILMAVLAALAWVLTVAQSRDMGVEPGTMGLALPLFLLLWVTMMVAMMFPSVAPVAITWARAIGRQSAGAVRAARIAQFAGGYLLAWTAFGLLAYGVLAAAGRLVDGAPEAGRWLGAAAFLLAGLYQFGPLKRVCLLHCRNPLSHLMRYAHFRPWARDLRVGAHHGLYCVGCCWGLMIVLVPLGVMNVAAMAGLAAVIFLEKLWRRGPLLTWAVGLAFLVLGVLAPFQDWLLPGLQMSEPSMNSMTDRPH
jgi:predicted metal-binding membrane protein